MGRKGIQEQEELKKKQKEICEFNYASIVFTVQRLFVNIWRPYVEPAASYAFKLETATHIRK